MDPFGMGRPPSDSQCPPSGPATPRPAGVAVFAYKALAEKRINIHPRDYDLRDQVRW
jgi:hypothetical protein